jgi:hypothetical protein
MAKTKIGTEANHNYYQLFINLIKGSADMGVAKDK